MTSTAIRIKKGTRIKIGKLKQQWQLDSFDDVINELFRRAEFGDNLVDTITKAMYQI